MKSGFAGSNGTPNSSPLDALPQVAAGQPFERYLSEMTRTAEYDPVVVDSTLSRERLVELLAIGRVGKARL